MLYRLFVIAVVVSGLVGSARGDITAADADFDGSGKVDITDFLQFVAAFGTQQGQSTYDAKYDLDGSGGVDIADFLLFVNVFDQTVQQVPVVPVDSVEGDRAALVALYHATDGDNWRNNTNWLSNKPLNEWYRISTNAQGRVVSFNLWRNQLAGPIPSELGNLTKLERLSLSYNELAGAIPSELGNLSNLIRLELDNNQLAGAIPSELGNLTKLEKLELNSNQLSGPIPSELGKLSNLATLDLYNNQLSGPIPLELGNLSKLQLLYLGNNPNLCMPSALINWKFYWRLIFYQEIAHCFDGDRVPLMALYNCD